MPPGPTSTLSPQQIELLMRQAGFPASEINTGIGVAMAESGGNPMAHNAKPPDDSYGLFQINMLGNLGPARRKQFGIKRNEDLYDPLTNTKAAYIVWKGSGWKAWTTYTSGKYKGGMTGVGVQAEGAIDGLKQLNPINGVSDSINAFGKNLLKGVSSIAGVAVGLTLLILGFIILLRQNDTVKSTVKTALAAAPTGKAATVAKKVT